jgi:hypothetical protein
MIPTGYGISPMMAFLSHSSEKETRTSNRRSPGKISDRILGVEPTFRPTDYAMIYLVHDVPVNVGQAIFTPLMAMGQAVVIDSEEVEAGGLQRMVQFAAR